MKKRSAKPKTTVTPWAYPNFLTLLAGVLLLGLVVLQEDNFRWLGPSFVMPNLCWNFLFVVALALIAYGFSKMPPVTTSKDLSRWVAYPILAVILGVALYLRLFRADQPYSGYWADPATEISDVRELLDTHVFYMIFPEGGREPLFSYLAAFIWTLFPSLKALLVQRLTADVINLAALWLFYRVGRELTGKRLVGLLFAGLGAASKSLLLLNLCGMRVMTLTLGVSLIFLLQIKLFKKTDLKHFLYWGVALAASLYTYTVIRLWIPFFALTTLGFILWNKKDKAASWPVKAACSVFIFFYLFFYLDSMLGIFYQNAFSKLWMMNLPIWAFWQFVFAALFIYGYRSGAEKDKWVCGWGLGLLLTGILSHPVALHPEVVARIMDQSVLPKTIGGWFSLEFIQSLLTRFWRTYLALFNVGSGRSDMNVLGDCFYDFQATILIALGVIYAALKPTRWNIFLIVSVLVAIVPYWLTADLHAAKLLGTAVPLLLLAAIALGALIESSFQSKTKVKWLGWLVVAGVVLIWGWELNSSYQRVYNKWWWEVWNDDICVSRAVEKFTPQDRVYLIRIPDSIPHSGHFFDVNTQSIVQDGQTLYLLQPANVIEVHPNEARKDVVVIVSPLMKQLVEQIKREYPKSVWEPTWQYYQKPHDELPFLYAVLISTDQISDKPGKLFSFHVSPANFWIRQAYVKRFSFREGVVEAEDASQTLNPDPDQYASHAMSAVGTWTAPEDGSYTFTVQSGEASQLMVDGKVVLTHYSSDPTNTVSTSVSLKKGDHQVHISTYFILGRVFPAISVENKASNYKVVLGS